MKSIVLKEREAIKFRVFNGVKNNPFNLLIYFDTFCLGVLIQ